MIRIHHILNISDNPNRMQLSFPICYNQMKSEAPSHRSRLQLTSSDLDPLEVNELILQTHLFLPVLSSGFESPRAQPMIFKLTRDKNLDEIIIYLLSEVDLYFLYRFDLSQEHIADLNMQYRLSLKRMADLVEFVRISLGEVQRAEKEAVLEMTEEGAQLVFSKMVGGKVHTVLVLSGREESEEVVSAQVAYRYGALRERIVRKEERIAYLRETVRQKYPHLLKNFKQI